MSLFNWITSKIQPTAADKPSTSTSNKVLALSKEAVDSVTVLAPPVKSPSPSSSSIPIQNESVVEEDANKATLSFAPPASGSYSSSAFTTNISRGKDKVRNIDPALTGGSSRLSSTARDSNPSSPTPYPPPKTTTTMPLIGGGPVPRDEFNEFKKDMESQMHEANTRTQEAYRQLWEQEQRHKSERLNWQQQFDSMEKPLSSEPSRSVPQQISPRDGQESYLRVNTQGNGNVGAGQADGLSLSSHMSLPFKLRKLSTELVLGRAEACMILREWSEMEKRSHEAMAMASNIHHEPLTARCWFFLGVACYHLNKWALSSDSFDFAKPCVGVYITAREFRSWKQKVDSAMGASPAGSIETMSNNPSRNHARSTYNRGWEDLGGISSSGSTISTPSVRSAERVSNIGRMNFGSPWSGRSTPESIGDPISSPEEVPIPHKRSRRGRYNKVLPETLPTTSIPTHGDRSVLPLNPSTSTTSLRDSSFALEPDRLVCRPSPFPPGLHSEPSPLDVDGRKTAIEYLHRKTPSQPRSRGPPLTVVIPDISFPVRPRQSRLYTPGDDHVYPRNPLRQGPRLRLIIPVKIFPGPESIISIPLRPSRLYMPDKPDIALYPQKPFRQGERLKVNIPSPEPVSPPLEISRPPATNKLPGYHIMSESSSTGYSPVQPQRPPPLRLQGRQVFPKARSSTTSSFGKLPSNPSNSSLPFCRSSYREISSSTGYSLLHNQRPLPSRRAQGRQIFRPKARSSTTSSFGKLPSRPSNPSLPFSRFSYRESDSTLGESFDEVSRFIQELSQPAYIKRHRVNRRSFSGSDSSPEELSGQTYNSAVPGGLRVVKRASSTPESSPGKPPPIPRRPGLRVVNGTPSTPESSPEKIPSLPSPPRLRVVNRSSSTSESSPERPPIPIRLHPPIVNCTSSTHESSLDQSSRKHVASPENTSFTPDGRSMSRGEAVWFPDTGSGCARFLDSPEDHPDGLFNREITHPYEVEYDDSRKGVPIEIGMFDSPQASSRPDIRQMVWRPPSTRDSMQPHGRGVLEKSDSSDETENMAFVDSLGLGITMPTETPRWSQG
ncbi:hypothetical protein MMC29_001402 [Sticta canariensis]|nr:hypothetical protein [Sticta canariensis]